MKSLLLSALDALGDDPARIQQLRKIVIGLAVSGKLGTNPGRVDLPRVTPEGLPAHFDEVSHFTPLGAVARVEKGKTGIKQALAGDFPLVVTGASRIPCDHFDFEGAAAIVPLVSSTGHGKASLNRLHYQEGRFALGTILCAIFPLDSSLITARFIFEYLSAFKEELLVSRMIGTANVSLSIGKVSDVPVPIVSPGVQKKVDELMALCDQLDVARAERNAARYGLAAASLARLNAPDPCTFDADVRFALDALPVIMARHDQVRLFRQTILNLAVRGKLAPQDPSDEPATEVVKRIEASRAKKSQGNRTESSLPPIQKTPFDLPSGWTWARFPELGSFGRGKSKHRPRNDPSLFDHGVHPVIQTGDVARSKGVISSYTSKYNDFGLAQSMKWPKGTLCITIAANIADSGILGFDACFPDSVVGFVPESEFSDAKYFEYFVRTAKENLLEFAPATAQKNINLEILTSVLIPLPPRSEMLRIVKLVDELMSLCDQLEASQTEADSARSRLLDALLAEALQPTLGSAAQH